MWPLYYVREVSIERITVGSALHWRSGGGQRPPGKSRKACLQVIVILDL